MYLTEEQEEIERKKCKKNQKYQTFLKSILFSLIIYILISKPIKSKIETITKRDVNVIISLIFLIIYLILSSIYN